MLNLGLVLLSTKYYSMKKPPRAFFTKVRLRIFYIENLKNHLFFNQIKFIL
jgi:hypothetical protein